MLMPFGKFKDHDIEDIPGSYLKFASENFDTMSKKLTECINDELEYRERFDINIEYKY